MIGAYLFAVHVQSIQDLVQVDLLDGLLALLAEGEVTKQDRAVEAEGVHVLTGRRVDLTRSRQNGTLRLGLCWRNQIRDAHKLEQPLALCVVLLCHADCPSRELLHVLCCAGLFGLLQALVGLLLSLVSPRELARLQLWWGAVEDVERFDAVVADSQGAVEHSHQVRSGLALLVHELLAIGSDCDEEGVDAHRPVTLSARAGQILRVGLHTHPTDIISHVQCM